MDWTATAGWSSSGSGTETRDARNLVKIDETLSELLVFGPSSKRQELFESESLPEICSPMLDASCVELSEKFGKFKESRQAGASCCAASPLAKRRKAIPAT